MTLSGFVVTAGLLLAAPGFGQGEPAKTDFDKLQGTWITVSLATGGKPVIEEKNPSRFGPTVKLVYEGNKWRVVAGDKTVATGTWKIDATKTPKELDVMDESGTVNDKTKLAIYELEGDTFKYCIGPAGKPRPAEFSSKEGSDNSLLVSRREKP